MPYAPEAFGMPLQPPSQEHPFGTDNFGRDVATRVVYAAHLNLLIGIVPTAITFVVGIDRRVNRRLLRRQESTRS